MALATHFRDRLPKSLCFPIGLETLSTCVPCLDGMNAAVVFVWQSTWAAQILKHEYATSEIAIMQVRPDLPMMRINTGKLSSVSNECQIVIAEFAVPSGRRKRILDAFVDHGAALLAEHIDRQSPKRFMLNYEVEADRFKVAKNLQHVW